MSRKNKRYTASFKAEAVERMQLGCNVSELARELKLSRTLLYLWFLEAQERQAGGAEEDPQARRIRELEQKVAALQRVIGQQKLEADFFAGALRRVEELAPQPGEPGASRSMPRSAAGPRRKAN